MKIAIPRMGRYTELVEEIGKYLGWDLIIPPIVSEKTTEPGIRCMNEMMCFPAKVTLGSLIYACNQGAERLIMFNSCGECRLKAYWILQERALRNLGYDVIVRPVRLGWKTPSDIKAINPSVSYWKAWGAFIKLITGILKIDKEMWADIPDETDKVRIGITGEIYTVLEPAVNKNLVQKIQKMGALVHNSLPLSYYVFKKFYERGWMKRSSVDRRVWLDAKKRAHEYFPEHIGGHGNESIIHTIYYALKGFDGVIHMLPFPCMPESTIAIIIDDIGRDFSIPVMRLIFDAHTAEAGLNTRLEAFVDILKRRKMAKIKGKGGL